jgi:hypothetical protein
MDEQSKAQVVALHQHCLELMHRRKLAEAAELADSISEQAADPDAPNVHTWDTMWAFCERLGDYEKRRNPERALRLYRMALASYRLIASSATSGSEGSMYMLSVNRVEAKMRRLQDPPRQWWQRLWNR